MPVLLRTLAVMAVVLALPATALAGTKALQPFPSNLDTVPIARR